MAQINIDVDLTVMVDGEHPLHITGAGQKLVVHIPNRGSALYLWRTSRYALSELQGLVRREFSLPLDRFDVEVRVADRVIASTENSRASGLPSRLLGIAPLQVQWDNIIPFLLQR